MAEQLLNEASYGLVRTNPKLTANVKLVVDSSNNLYLDSFSANTTLSKSRFKAFKIDKESSYEKDVFNFFQAGTLPKDIAFEAFQQFEDIAVLSKYRDQYEMFYAAGTSSISSEVYTEDLGMLAPLWLGEQIPNYFVIFRVENPASVNNKDATEPTDGTQDAQTSEEFTENFLENCTAVKTFDLTEESPLGSYLRNYRNLLDFPKAPLRASWQKNETFQWSGISYDKGGFVTKGEYAYEGLVTQDSTILQDEYFITQGFQRNGIMVANLINLQFLFTDEKASEYSYNRYVGMYVNSIDEGEFDLSGMGFYKGTEKSQTPPITTITEVSEKLNTPLELQNPNGILLYLDPARTSTTTGLPTPTRVDEVESIFYVQDKENNFHTIKKGALWGLDQIRLFDQKIDISLLTGFKKPQTYAKTEILEEKGHAMASFQFLTNPVDGYRIRFYDGNNFIDEVAASSAVTNGPGTSYEQFFNPNGTLAEVATALSKAINGGIPIGERFFDASYDDETVYVISRYAGSRFNQLSFELDLAYPVVQMNSFPSTTQSANFTGGGDIENAQLKVETGAQDRFTTDRFVKTKGGYANILSYTPYLEEPIYASDNNVNTKDPIIGYKDIDKYNVIQIDTDQVFRTSIGQCAVYVDYKPSFGRFSFFPVRDFDFDFYSTLYSQEGELAYEYEEYNQLGEGTAGTGEHLGVGSDTDIIDFYEEGGFADLIGLLKPADPDVEVDARVQSEYDRLEENYLRTQAVASRITPYINKWCYYQYGKDVRNHPYRLDVSESFGVSNFAPSRFDFDRDPIGFTHEWYYLCEIPEYFTKDAVEVSWSYFDKAPIEEQEEVRDTYGNLISPYIPGTFQKVTSDGFIEYFLVDNFNFKNEKILIDKQIRWGEFSGGDANNFAETFLRGVKIIAKPKAKPSVEPNFNARSLEYVSDDSLDGYKFSTIMIPNSPDKPNVQIKFVKNDKWKTITMMIFLNIDWKFVDGGRQSIDRTLLYSLQNIFKTSGTEIIPDSYADSFMQGAIDLLSSTTGSPCIIKGMLDVDGNPTQFLTDITLGANGSYNNIQWTVGADTFEVQGISNVISDDTLEADGIFNITTSTSVSLPSLLPSPTDQRSAIYIILGGGFNAFGPRLSAVSFAEILDKVSNGDPTIIYETINEDGSRVFNEDGSLSQTFMIELRAQDSFLKSIYVSVLPDPQKPTVFNLTDLIGYDLSMQRRPRVIPMSRHSGYYEPISRDLLYFRDPYLDIDFNGGGSVTGDFTGNPATGGGSNIPDEHYKLKVLDLMRYANTQFNSEDLDFGQIHNFFYHKVNTEDPSTILELSVTGAFQSVYPLINEVGIDFRDFYIFSSNWEPSYYRKSIDKAIVQPIMGTRSMIEKKSFLGSKYLKVPQQVTLETFIPTKFTPSVQVKSSKSVPFTSVKRKVILPNLEPGEFLHVEDDVKIEIFMFIQKRLIEYFFGPVKEVFEKYVNPQYGFGNLTTLDDDVREYITLNIIPLYTLGTIELFTRALRAEEPTDYTTAELDDAAKFDAGLTLTDNFSSKLLNTNPFDTRLIYNKRTGYSEQIGLSVTLNKK